MWLEAAVTAASMMAGYLGYGRAREAVRRRRQSPDLGRGITNEPTQAGVPVESPAPPQLRELSEAQRAMVEMRRRMPLASFDNPPSFDTFEEVRRFYRM